MSHEIGETLESPENYFADDNYGLKQCCLCGKIINEIEMECHLVVNHKLFYPIILKVYTVFHQNANNDNSV